MPELCVCTSCVLDSRAAVSNQGALYIRDAERGPKMGDFTWWFCMENHTKYTWVKTCGSVFRGVSAANFFPQFCLRPSQVYKHAFRPPNYNIPPVPASLQIRIFYI